MWISDEPREVDVGFKELIRSLGEEIDRRFLLGEEPTFREIDEMCAITRRRIWVFIFTNKPPEVDLQDQTEDQQLGQIAYNETLALEIVQLDENQHKALTGPGNKLKLN